MLAFVQHNGERPPSAVIADREAGQAISNEPSMTVTSSFCGQNDVREICLPMSRPMLPPLWRTTGREPEPSYSERDESPDVWKELNSESPSIQRVHCLWAYFNMPALSLADHVEGVASIFAQTDGFHSILHVTSSLLHGPHLQNIRSVYFGKDLRALVFKEIQLAIDLRGAGEAFEKAERLRDEHMLPSLLVVKNVSALRIERDGRLVPYGFVTIRKHKAFRGIVSLAPPRARVYDVYDMIEALELGDCSGVFVVGTWILDLRIFSALKMLFRSELRNAMTDDTEYLLDAALELFGGVRGQPDGEGVHDEDALELAGREDDELTESTAVPAGHEGTQEQETPSSLPEGEQMDENDAHKLVELTSAPQGTSSPVKSSSYPDNEQQQPSQAANNRLTTGPTEAEETTDSRDIFAQCTDSIVHQDEKSSSDAPKPSRDNDSKAELVTSEERVKSLSTQENAHAMGNGHPSNLPRTATPDQDVSVQAASWLEKPKGLPIAATGNEGPQEEALQCHIPEIDHVEKAGFLKNQPKSHSRLETTASEHEPDSEVGAFGISEDQDADQSCSAQCLQAGFAGALVEISLSCETSSESPLANDKVLENELCRWMASREVKEEEHVTSSGIPNIPDATWYPAHEYEYWAVETKDLLLTVEHNYESDEPGTLSLSCGQEVYLLSVTNTSWAFCRTREGELGYVPTVAIPFAFRKLFKHTKMYARKTAYVDRICKWKGIVFYPGDAVVILADRGKWVLVRDYFRPFRQAYIPHFRIKFAWQQPA